MECLGHSIRNAIEVGNWSPIRLARDGPPLFHLLFADNLVLFVLLMITKPGSLKAFLLSFVITRGIRSICERKISSSPKV